MSLSIYFRPKEMNINRFEEVRKKLEEAGETNPKGRLFHSSFGTKNNLQVFDVWDTKENFEKFGQTLMPILHQLGIDPGEPEINEVYKIEENDSANENLSIAKSMYKFFNERKFDEALKNLSDNVIIHNMAQNIQMNGKEGFLGFMNFWVSAFPDAKVEIKSMNVSGDNVITEFRGRGTNKGILDTPMGKIGPTGKKIDIPFCEIFEIRNGKLVSSHLYFDVATMMQQLELVPEKVS